MAFDREDTDELYELSIRPVLRDNGLIPIIINRSQNNDDLNNQIVAALNTADCCVADLTYTRPSVYFEAGYAQKSVPVIYTVRADHLGRNQPDDLRVHFDLQMKPIVRWRQPDDRQFRSTLQGRLRATVLRDWKRAQSARKARQKDRGDFAALSVTQRLAEMRKQAMLALRPHGFRKWAIDGGEHGVHYADLSRAPHRLVSLARNDRTARIACIFAQESLPTTVLQRLYNAVISLKYRIPADDRNTRALHVHVFCMSLRPVPATRVESVFTNYGRGDRAGRLLGEDILNHERRAGGGMIAVHTTLDVLGEIRSTKELRGEMRSVVKGSRT